jgi:anaerobic selenocysteine-containing dehydrogenase
MGEEMIKTTCLRCLAGCGMYVRLSDGVPVSVEGDPDSVTGQGILCIRGKATLEYVYNENRLRVPLIREGERGSGRWREATWGEALDLIASTFTQLRDDHGAESVAFIEGGSKGYLDAWLSRFSNKFGSPNVTKAAQHCFLPTFFGSKFTYGALTRPDFEHPPECLVVWGANKHETALPEGKRKDMALENGKTLIVIDPAPTALARKATEWVCLRPGSDLALALAFINVIIREGLYDSGFVDAWCEGFDELTEHVAACTAEWAETKTGVPAEQITRIARTYATTKPAAICSGNGLEHYPTNLQMGRALAILRSITGNLGIHGGDIFWARPPLRHNGDPDLVAHDELPGDVMSVNYRESIIPLMPFALHQNLTTAMLEGAPYSIRGAYVMGSDPLLTWPESEKVKEAFSSLDFLVVADLHMTPTAALADVVLPVASYLEINSVHVGEFVPEVRATQAITNVGEARSDYSILADLADRMGLDWGWDTVFDALDFILEPSGMTYDELCERGMIPAQKLYGDHEAQGFHTDSGKIELYSSQLEEWGFDPLPTFRPLLRTDEAYPLLLTTWKMGPFVHSGNREVGSLRKLHPFPVALVHPTTAERYDIQPGKQMTIETEKGRIVHIARTSKHVAPTTVIAEHGWWFPERGPLDGWDESNINVLTSSDRPFAPEMGSAQLRGLPCRIAPVDR